MRLAKYHALGNDYLVLAPDETATGQAPRAAEIQRLCDRHYGVGSDGILFGPLAKQRPDDADFGLRIFNPDASEAEKSGNGLRIFARYLWDQQRVGEQPFSIDTPGGRVSVQVLEQGRRVTVAMGQVSFDSAVIPVTGPRREVLDERLTIAGSELRYSAASVGNPHCVVLCDEAPQPELARRLGPLLETDARFPHRSNVQFMQVLDRNRIRIEIWERGAGYTLASGSSSTAAAAVAHRLGHCDAAIAVTMPGGEIDLTFDSQFNATMTGGVTRVGDITIDPELFQGC